MLTWAPAEPAVDEALCASFDELVSVEKPESCMTLPLPSPPLFGSFLPLCELLRLLIRSDDDWISPAPPLLLPSLLTLLFSLRRTRIPGSHSRLREKKIDWVSWTRDWLAWLSYLETIDEDWSPVIVLFAPDDAILCLRSGKVSITKSRNSNKAPTSFCSSCSDLVWSVWWWKLWWTRLLRWLYGPWAGVLGITSIPGSNVHSSVCGVGEKKNKIIRKVFSIKSYFRCCLHNSIDSSRSAGFQSRFENRKCSIMKKRIPMRVFFPPWFP